MKPKKNRMLDLLNSPTKEQEQPYGLRGALAKLWRKILFDLEINSTQWHKLMSDYVSDTRNGIPNTASDRTSMRGNLTKEFSRAEMSWKVFCKAMRFLQPVRVRFIVQFEWFGNKITEHDIQVRLGTTNTLRERALREDPNHKDILPGAYVESQGESYSTDKPLKPKKPDSNFEL